MNKVIFPICSLAKITAAKKECKTTKAHVTRKWPEKNKLVLHSKQINVLSNQRIFLSQQWVLNLVKLEFGNIGFSGVRETGVPGEKPSVQSALCHLCCW